MSDLLTASIRPQPSALDVSDVSVSFGGVRAVSDVSLRVDAGEIVSIIGPNGAGKTTLLNAVCNVVPKSDGSVEHYGRPITTTRPAQLIRNGVGRSFQDPQLIDDASVLENLLCGAHNSIGYTIAGQIFRRRRSTSLEQRATRTAMELLDLVGMRDTAGTEAASLPYGSRKVIDILRATIAMPSLLLLDEPSSGLDAIEQNLVEQLLLTIHKDFKIPMLLVEHHMDLVGRVSDRVVALISGSVAMSGTPSDVLESAEFSELIGGTLPTKATIESTEDA